MFKINKSSVRYMDQNMAKLVVQDIASPDSSEGMGAGVPGRDTVDQAKFNAQKIESDARSRADAIISEAMQKAQQVVQEAWKQGFAAGKDAGLEAGRQHISKLKEMESGLLRTVTSKFDEFELAYAKDSEQTLLELSCDVAEKVINNYVDRNDTFIIEIVKAALSGFDNDRKVIVRISAHDYDRYVVSEERMPEQALERDKLSIVRDEALKPGDCIVECESRIIDAGIDSQLAVLKKALVSETDDGGSK